MTGLTVLISLQNGEIDIMGDISYTDERAQRCFSRMNRLGEEKYILYADLSDTDIGMSDFKSLDGETCRCAHVYRT